MLIRRPDHIEAQPVTMSGAQGVAMRVLVGKADNAPNFAMRQFEVEPGGHTPLHQHNYEHEVLIQSGSGVICEGNAQNTKPIAAGDVLFIPANEVHQFQNTGSEHLKFICMVPMRFDCGKDQCQPTPGT